MATKIIQEITDDLTGEAGASTVEFGWEGTTYEIDLTEGNRTKLREIFADYVAAGRKVSARRGRGVGPRGTAVAKVDRDQQKAVRRWAQEHPDIVGFTVGDRGRLPENVYTLYNAHAGRNSAAVAV